MKTLADNRSAKLSLAFSLAALLFVYSARAQELPEPGGDGGDDGPRCGAGTAVLCDTRTTTECKRWTLEKVAPWGTAVLICTEEETVVTKKYYP